MSIQPMLLEEHTGALLPIAVDLDGTLVRADTLHEGFIDCMKRAPLDWPEYIRELSHGRAALKRRVAINSAFDAASLPYNEDLLAYLREQRQTGRKLGLFTAADQSVADAVAAHLGLFDVVKGSDGTTNLKGLNKVKAIEAAFGERFAYAGDEAADKPIFDRAAQVVLVGQVQKLRTLLAPEKAIEAVFPSPAVALRLWVRALRLQHWGKNSLIFVSPILSFEISRPIVLLQSIALFVLLGLVASACYILNDLVDLEADRRHPRKRQRPFAAGLIPVQRGLFTAVGLIAVALALSLFLPRLCTAALLAYLIVTLSYTLVLKKQPIVDVFVLAGLFTLRVIAGGFLVSAPASPWLLTFSMLFFLALACVKRYAELDRVLSAGGTNISARGYTAKDLPLILTTGSSSGFAAVVIFTIYLINEQYPSNLYGSPQYLWGMMPLLLIWILRVWHLTVHGRMHDDPVVFALTDQTSLLLGCFAIVILVAAWA
jgi:4-hydroxybenzoate polyprenyltransferase/phosphoserine phosphatase